MGLFSRKTPWDSPALDDADWLDFIPKNYDEFRRCLLGACHGLFRAVRMDDGPPPALLLEIKSLGPGCNTFDLDSIFRPLRRNCQTDLFLRIPIAPTLVHRARILIDALQRKYLPLGTPDPPEDLMRDLYVALVTRPGTFTRPGPPRFRGQSY